MQTLRAYIAPNLLLGDQKCPKQVLLSDRDRGAREVAMSAPSAMREDGYALSSSASVACQLSPDRPNFPWAAVGNMFRQDLASTLGAGHEDRCQGFPRVLPWARGKYGAITSIRLEKVEKVDHVMSEQPIAGQQPYVGVSPRGFNMIVSCSYVDIAAQTVCFVADHQSDLCVAS